MTAPSRGVVLILLHLGKPPSSALLAEAAEVVTAAGYSVEVAQDDPEGLVASHAGDARLLVSVGGDGTLLYAARLAAPLGIPVLGVNRGQLGFLNSVEIQDLPAALAAFCAGECRSQLRDTLRAQLATPGGSGTESGMPVAVNEVAVRADAFNLVRLRVTGDHQLVGDFDADGMIVATSVGSTAYSLSAGGPPLHPAVAALVITALNPHGLSNRSLVVPDSLDLKIELLRGEATVAADGRIWGRLEEGFRLLLGKGPQLTLVQPPGTSGFFERLRSKTGFGTVLKLPYQDGSPERDRALPLGSASEPSRT